MLLCSGFRIVDPNMPTPHHHRRRTTSASSSAHHALGSVPENRSEDALTDEDDEDSDSVSTGE